MTTQVQLDSHAAIAAARQVLQSLRAAQVEVKLKAPRSVLLRGELKGLDRELLAKAQMLKWEILALVVAEEANGPVKEFMVTVAQWPPAARDFWSELAAALARRYSLPLEEAELMSFTRITMGCCAPMPRVSAKQNPDGTWPDWTGSWPGAISWDTCKARQG